MTDRNSDKLMDVLSLYDFEIMDICCHSWTMKYISPEGEPYEFSIQFDGTFQNFVSEFVRHACEFNIDDNAEQWIPVRGTNGIPEKIVDILQSSVNIARRLADTAETLNKVYERTVREEVEHEYGIDWCSR